MLTLARFDADCDGMGSAAPITPELFAALPAPWLSNGFYTLAFPDGSHRTYRVRLDREGVHSGRRTLALLVGPDNSNDYECQGVVTDDGFELFKRFRAGKPAEHAAILWELARPDGERFDGYDLLVSKRCRLCMRELTTPDSIETEMGPTCRKKMGL